MLWCDRAAALAHQDTDGDRDPMRHDHMTLFHKHLDTCERCEQNPFDLCPVGLSFMQAIALRVEAQPTAKEVQRWPLGNAQKSPEDGDG